MWYETSNTKLDYSKAIAATQDGFTFILLPSNEVPPTYDWFNLVSGVYDSRAGWTTPQDAVACYKKEGYTVANINMSFEINEEYDEI